MKQIGSFYVLTKAEHDRYHTKPEDRGIATTQKHEGWGTLYLSSGQTGSVPCLYPSKEQAEAAGLKKNIIAHVTWEN
jgi:hypothetical protein